MAKSSSGKYYYVRVLQNSRRQSCDSLLRRGFQYQVNHPAGQPLLKLGRRYGSNRSRHRFYSFSIGIVNTGDLNAGPEFRRSNKYWPIVPKPIKAACLFTWITPYRISFVNKSHHCLQNLFFCFSVLGGYSDTNRYILLAMSLHYLDKAVNGSNSRLVIL